MPKTFSSQPPSLETGQTAGIVTAVSSSPAYTFSKPNQGSITLRAGLGVDGDAHQGATVRHRSRMRENPHEPNLRQVHLIHAELHDELNSKGFTVTAGQLGENITVRGIDLLHLPNGARLHLGDSAIIEITGLRDPCSQIDGLQPGLMRACLDRDDDGNLISKTGVMSIVLQGGEVKPRDPIRVVLPSLPWKMLEFV